MLDVEEAPAPKRDYLGLGLSGLGQLLITAGVVVLLFVVYEVWVTNIFSDHKQDQVHTQLIKQWAAEPDDPLVQAQSALPLPGGGQATLPVGSGIAVLYIPRFGRDFAKAVVEGTGDAQLAEGPGHYVGTQLPGQKGNFAVAGHRVGKGEPFLNLDQLKPGDPLVVQTKSSWYVYTVLGSGDNLSAPDPVGVVGREIVSPSNVQVIAPVPTHPEVPAADAIESLITLTTCHPKFSASQRMIIHGTLSRSVPVSGSALPRELGGTL